MFFIEANSDRALKMFGIEIETYKSLQTFMIKIFSKIVPEEGF